MDADKGIIFSLNIEVPKRIERGPRRICRSGYTNIHWYILRLHFSTRVDEEPP